MNRNRRIAEALREAGDLLEQQGANPFRVAAYRRAAGTVEDLGRDLGELLEQEGPWGLTALPHVGHGIAGAIREMLTTGRWGQLDRLRGNADPVRLFQRLPGIGPRLAQQIHDALDVDTLEALEVAAHDGSLESLPGIAPRRFNPEKRAWLPVLHTGRGRWHFTALFSNTARAHELGKTHDWVVLYSYDGHHRETQSTVVTETRGPLAGHRVVRGRETECRARAERETAPAAYSNREHCRAPPANPKPTAIGLAAIAPRSTASVAWAAMATTSRPEAIAAPTARWSIGSMSSARARAIRSCSCARARRGSPRRSAARNIG